MNDQTGAFGLIRAAGLRYQMQVAGSLILSSLLALLCGVWLIAAFAVLYGVLQAVMIVKARSLAPQT